MFAIITLLAALVCTENADGTWTCSSDGPSLGPDSGIVEDSEGAYVCTNCTAISSNECERIKNLVIDKSSIIISNCVATVNQLDQFDYELIDLHNSFSDFVPCPYTLVYTISQLKSQYGLASADNSQILAHIRDVVLPQWQATANYSFTQLNPDLKNSTANAYLYTLHAELCGIWSCSYSIAIKMLDEINSLRSSYFTVWDKIFSSLNEAQSIASEAQLVSCASCKLGVSSSGGGGGGSSGSETGCLECYLAQLRQINSNLDAIKSYLLQIKNDLYQFKTDFNREIQNLLDQIEELNYTANRIDDYLEIDQKQYLIKIKEAVISMTNQVHYFDDYILADFYKDHSDQQFDMNVAISEIPDGGGSTWENLTWFSRVEALLGAAAGFGTSSPSEDVDTSILNDYDQAIAEVEADSSGTDARESITTVFESLGDVLEVFNIFEGVSEPSEIFLLQDAPLPLHSSSDTAEITIQLPDTPALISFLRFVRYAFIAFYWFVALVGFAFAVVKLYSTVVSILRWSSSFLGTVFGG